VDNETRGVTTAELRSYVGEVALMAAIVTTLLCVPAGALLAGLLFLFGTSLRAFVTFGGGLNAVQGIVVWWLLCLLPALVYVAYVLPWSRRDA
jgi:hypothetical protein